MNITTDTVKLKYIYINQAPCKKVKQKAARPTSKRKESCHYVSIFCMRNFFVSL